jgi:hypothetical protein
VTERQLNVYDVLNRYCVVCGAELVIKPTGRPRSTCTDRCRQRRRRASRNTANAAAASTFRDSAAAPDFKAIWSAFS